VDLTPARGKWRDTLSIGQMQLLAIARALA